MRKESILELHCSINQRNENGPRKSGKKNTLSVTNILGY